MEGRTVTRLWRGGWGWRTVRVENRNAVMGTWGMAIWHSVVVDRAETRGWG